MNSFDDELNRRLETLREQGLRRELRRVDSPQSPRIEIGGKMLLNFSSNDYLGLANHPALKELKIPRTGQSGAVGALVTKTLVIAGEAQVTTAGHPRGALLRAYDKATGKDAGTVFMPAPQSGSPMTYMLNGKQYIVVAVSGGNYSGEYIACSLPSTE